MSISKITPATIEALKTVMQKAPAAPELKIGTLASDITDKSAQKLATALEGLSVQGKAQLPTSFEPCGFTKQ